MVQSLPSMPEALGLLPSTKNKQLSSPLISNKVNRNVTHNTRLFELLSQLGVCF